jgi:hypothetical protein
VAEQRVDIRGVKARTVTVAPEQHIHGAQGPDVRGWTEALVRGPVERLGLLDRVQEGEAARERGDHQAAASAFEEVAEALRHADYAPVADKYLEQAGAALAECGDSERAYQIYARIARAGLDDGEFTALFKARRARELVPSEMAWEADGLVARAGWPEQTPGDEQVLRTAWGKSKDTGDEAEWASALVELLLLNGRGTEALEVAREARGRSSLAPGDRLDLELDFLELVEQESEETEAEDAWRDLLDWTADLRRTSIEVLARVWQRRGIALALRGDQDGARRAFGQAVHAWGREQGFEDQMAEAYFSSIATAVALGDQSAAFDEARPLASSLRGREQSATARIERLERRGLRRLSNGEYPDAFRALATAHNLARKAGNLSDFFQVTEELGDTLAAAEHPVQALSAYVAAGEPKKAAKLAEGMSVDAVLNTVELESPRWQRLAAWAALASAGRLISDEGAAALIPRALEELEREPPTGFFANASYYAVNALANAVCAAPSSDIERVLALARERLLVNAGDPKGLADPLVVATRGGVSDETETLVTAFLDDDVYAKIEPNFIGDLISTRDEQRERVIEAAKNGSRQALDALAFGDLVGDDQELVHRGRERLDAVIAAPVREVSTDGGVTTTTVGFGSSYAPEGLLARRAPESLRNDLIDKWLSILIDDGLPIMMRAGAVEGLHNLSAAFPEARVTEVVDNLHRFASTPDAPNDFEQLGQDDPLARFKINMAPPEVLRSAALEALAVIVKRRTNLHARLSDVLPGALASSVPSLVLAGLRALQHTPSLEFGGVPPQAFAVHTSPGLRLASFGVLLARDDQPPEPLIVAMAADEDPSVRRAAVEAASTYQVRDAIASLTEDLDCFNRALARRAVAELETA